MRRTLVMMASNITNNTSKRFFAPLKEPFNGGSQLRKLEGVVFDMDGTLWYVHPLSSQVEVSRYSYA